MKNYSIKSSNIEGKGAFSNKNIIKGETITIFEGDYVNSREINRRIAVGEERLDDPLQLEDDLFLDLDEEYLHINHSCNPNSGLRGKNELIAIRNIAKGEEITYDYSAVVPKDSDWTMQCKCNASNCRNVIGNISSIPNKQLQMYLDAGTIQDYLKET